MEERLISKKDLLKTTGISYGQLYRWKRKNIIPEEWFIKKSVSTGQETFFPMDKILERIYAILALKDEASLDDLSRMFSGKVKNGELAKEYLIKNNIVSNYVLGKLESIIEDKERYSMEEVVLILTFNNILDEGSISLNEAMELINKIRDNYKEIKENEVLVIKRKLGVLYYYLTERRIELIEDKEAKVLIKINFEEIRNYVNRII
ncbi:DUF4004 family protein [uncultured Clostridium sp.]|uniref:DUF4004 family protein n=1 Tax=uncultured Clostridium sp. TaxID=59620 RepID=UPI002625AAAA|nr:DUF4004 family protein [uncultured Clostridium sp.]